MERLVSDSPTRHTRPWLLYSWGASFLIIAQKAYHRAEDLHGPIGFIVQALAYIATPILHPMQRRWLSILSFIDRQILTIEDLAMTVFPPSSYLFSMVDKLAFMSESLPKHFDDTIKSVMLLIQKLPLFQHKKDTMVDVKCDEQDKAMVMTNEGVGGSHEIPVMQELDVEDEKKVESKRKRKMEEEMKEVEDTCNDIIEELEKMGMVNDKRGKSEKVNVDREGVVEVVKDAIRLESFDEGWAGTKRDDI